MKVHGLCVVRNEIDIIERCLRAAARWCSSIYVLDNGSDDGTWERVNELAGELGQVVPFRQDSRPFDSGIREDILRHYASRARPGDWWCILDADEFYVDDPHRFLSTVPAEYQVVWKQDLAYYFTEEDLERYRKDPSLYADDVPIEKRLRYYSADWSEMRFFRHPVDPARVRIPWEAPKTYPMRIRVKHFQYRSPSQIQKRLDTRRNAIESGRAFPHESRKNWLAGGDGSRIVVGPSGPDDIPTTWEERVVPVSGLHLDAGDGRYARGIDWIPPGEPRASRSLFAGARRLAGKVATKLLRSVRRLRRTSN
jgi:hypothetical protein